MHVREHTNQPIALQTICLCLQQEEMMRITKRNGQKETGITTTNALFRGGGELSYKRGFDGKGGDGDGSQMQQ